MKRSQKILVTIVVVAGLSAAAVATVSAQGGWGGCQGYAQNQFYTVLRAKLRPQACSIGLILWSNH